MDSRRRLLFISPCIPDPRGTGWEQRAHAFLAAYSRFMDVVLWFQPTFDRPDPDRVARAAGLCVSATAFDPGTLNDPRSELRRRLIGDVTSADVVHVFRYHEMIEAINHRCMVWDIDELPWLLRDSSRRVALIQSSREERRRLMEIYGRGFRKCRRVFACSEVERQGGFGAVSVVPNVVPEPAAAEAASAGKDGSLLFVGNLNHSPNIDGLQLFGNAVLPILAGSLPDVTLNVVGRAPASGETRAVVSDLGKAGPYRFHFDVPDCAPYYARSAASIVPLRFGGGTRVKIIESFAHRCPVVSTTKGCEGLAVEHGRQLLVADDPGAFAAACVTLIRNPSLGEELAAAAYEHYRGQHTQNVADRLIREAVSGLA